MRNSVCCLLGGVAAVVGMLLWSPNALSQQLPAGLASQDPMVRIQTIRDIGKTKLKMAEGKVAAMAQTDPHAGVREAACLALADLQAMSKIQVLEVVAANDPNAGVRAAASKALRTLRGEPAPTGQPLAAAPGGGDPADPEAEMERDKYKAPTLSIEESAKAPQTRHIAIGFGTMGGYGIAALDVRGRIPTGAAGLPWVGVELGGGWTPPTGYQITAGPVGNVNHDPNRWRIISAGGSVLLYFHRMHYVPVRTGWDIGRGMYAILGYGFEHLNVEGFFSWGVEVGILYQPVIEKKLDKIVVCDGDSDCETEKEELWPVIPFVRFSLHFYLA